MINIPSNKWYVDVLPAFRTVTGDGTVHVLIYTLDANINKWFSHAVPL